MHKKILVTGAGGQLGSELARQLGNRAIPIDVDKLNLTSREQVHGVVEELNPDAVINTAAYTAVDLAESNSDLCFAVNASGPKFLAEVTTELAIPLVQISTDYVFGDDPSPRSPRKETDIPSPTSVYAKSKLDGELAVAANPRHVVVRSCGLYGRPGPTASGNFITTMRRLGQERDSIKVVNDQACTPTWVPELAKAIVKLLEANANGTYHVTASGETTWFDLANEIFLLSNISCVVEPISTSDYGCVAARPPYSVLNCQKYEDTTGSTLMHWRDALSEYIRELSNV